MIIRYDFKQEPANGNPQLLYIIKDECRYEYDEKKSSTHNIAELCYIIRGSGHFHVEKNDYDIEQGDIYLINPYMPHGEYVKKGQDFHYFILGIANFSFPAVTNSEKPRKLPSNNKIPDILEHYLAELSAKKDKYKDVLKNLFEILLVEIQRLYKTKIEPSSSLQENTASRIKHFIDVNYLGSDCSSKMIANFFDKKLNTIEIKFKKQFGISIQRYVLQLRIETAKKHLQSDNPTIRDLAINCGFYNPSYFTQYFKKIVGITPTEYKKQLNANKE